MALVEMTAAAIAELAFKKFLETGAGELAKKFTSEAITKMDELRKVIWEKLRGNSKAEKAIQAIEGGSKSEIERLGVYLQDAIEDDPKFAAQVQAIAQEINAGKLQDNSTMTQINRENARGWQTKVEGGTAYIGEVHIHDKPPNS